MGWQDKLNDIIQRYAGQGGGTASAPENAPEDYQAAAQAAPPEVVSDGLSQAFKSDRTPPFPDLVSNLFGHSDPNQRAGLLNRLLGSAEGSAFAGLPALGGLAGLLRGGGQVTPEQANQVSPDQVREIAAHAEKQNPTVVDQVSSFYAQHPQVVKALGGAVLAIAVQHMVRKR